MVNTAMVHDSNQTPKVNIVIKLLGSVLIVGKCALLEQVENAPTGQSTEIRCRPA